MLVLKLFCLPYYGNALLEYANASCPQENVCYTADTQPLKTSISQTFI